VNGTPIAELAQAEQCDAAGRHEEAINLLARATRRGEVAAMTQLAKRLIVGDRAPRLPREGARFLMDATRSGGAEAAARLAVLAAIWVHVRQSWDQALELLVRAAERGWAPAQGQLQVLAAPSEHTGSVCAAEPDSRRWRALRRRIDLGFWTTAATGRMLHDDPVVRVFPDFVPQAACEWLIGQAQGRLERAEVYDPVAGADVVSAARTNTAAKFNLMETDLVHLLVQTRMAASCALPLFNMEGATVLHYAVGEQLTDHFDFVDPKTPNYAQEIARNGQRVLTFLVYLNDDYLGGETDFPKLNIRHRGQRGEGLYFINADSDGKPDLRTLHTGLPPVSGEKWLLSQFVRSRRVLQTGAAAPG
jgi:prolyl 4-hydroxylase